MHLQVDEEISFFYVKLLLVFINMTLFTYYLVWIDIIKNNKVHADLISKHQKCVPICKF